MNAGGDTIPFRRGAGGEVSGFVERGTFFARISPHVDPVVVTAVRAYPRPLGPDGHPAPYIYRRPPEMGDGLKTADVAHESAGTRVLMERCGGSARPRTSKHSATKYRSPTR